MSVNCPNCNLVNPDTAARCDCGYDFTTKEMAVSYLHGNQGDSAPPHEIKRTSVLLVILFVIITAGIYYPAWFLTRRKALNKLNSKRKLGSGVFIVAIVLFSASLLFEFAAGGAEFVEAVELMETLDLINDLLNSIAAIILIIQCFAVKNILSDHFSLEWKAGASMSGIATFFLQLFYLQYRINRL